VQIAVVGGGVCSPTVAESARLLGRLIAMQGYVLLCGGMGGVMEAACCGAREAGSSRAPMRSLLSPARWAPF